MQCDRCERLKQAFLESLGAADRAQTEVRIYLMFHQGFATVSDMDEYLALRAAERKTADQRHEAYLEFVHHVREHGVAEEAANGVAKPVASHLPVR